MEPAVFGAVSYLKDRINLAGVVNRAMLLLLPALFITYALFMLMALFVNRARLVRDLARAVNTGRKTAGLIVVIFVLGMLVGGGVFWLALASPLLVWGYMKAGQKKIALLLTLMIAAMPFAVDALSKVSAFSQSRLNRAVNYYLTDNWEPMALTELSSANQKDPQNAELLVAMANLYRRVGDLDGAEKFLERVLDKNPQDVKAINELGNIRFERKQFHDAEAMYRKGIELSPKSPELYYNLSKTYTEQFRTEDSVA